MCVCVLCACAVCVCVCVWVCGCVFPKTMQGKCKLELQGYFLLLACDEGVVNIMCSGRGQDVSSQKMSKSSSVSVSLVSPRRTPSLCVP